MGILEKVNPYWTIIKIALVIGIIVGSLYYARRSGYEARVDEENREKVAARLALDKFNAMWDKAESDAASARSAERFDYDAISKEITNDVAKALRRQPFDVKCTWPPELLALRNQAIQRANQAASGVSGTSGKLPSSSDK